MAVRRYGHYATNWGVTIAARTSASSVQTAILSKKHQGPFVYRSKTRLFQSRKSGSIPLRVTRGSLGHQAGASSRPKKGFSNAHKGRGVLLRSGRDRFRSTCSVTIGRGSSTKLRRDTSSEFSGTSPPKRTRSNSKGSVSLARTPITNGSTMATIDMVKQQTLDALGAWRYVQIGERKTDSLGDYARTFVASCEIQGASMPANGVWELEVLICEPYID